MFVANLPIVLNEATGTYDAWFDRHDHEPYKKMPRSGRNSLANLAFIEPATGRHGFHHFVLLTEGLPLDGSQHQMVSALTTTKEHPERLHVKVCSCDSKEYWVGCFCLWSIPAAPGETLIEFHGQLEDAGRRHMVLNKVRELLCLSPPTWGFNYDHQRAKSPFAYGELVVLQNPGTRALLPGIVVGDVAATGMLASNNSPGTMIFLQLVRYQPHHKDSIDHIETDFVLNGSPQSIDVTLFRTAPTSLARKWSKSSVVASDKIMEEVRRRIEVYLA